MGRYITAILGHANGASFMRGFEPTQAQKDYWAEIKAINKRFVCSGCGFGFATNSRELFLDHCVVFHDDMVYDFVLGEIAIINNEIEEVQGEDEPYEAHDHDEECADGFCPDNVLKV